MIDQFRRLHPSTFARALPIALVAAALIGIPSDLIDTPLFGRPVTTRPIDYVILVITAALIGLILAIRAEPPTGDEASPTEDQTPIWGGFVSFLAVGCPVCNQAVVAVVGTSGALSWWAPVQPLVGLAAIAMLVWALRRRLVTYEATACRLPMVR
jgi:hypothetical protein